VLGLLVRHFAQSILTQDMDKESAYDMMGEGVAMTNCVPCLQEPRADLLITIVRDVPGTRNYLETHVASSYAGKRAGLWETSLIPDAGIDESKKKRTTG
jgi:hypothetical protein